MVHFMFMEQTFHNVQSEPVVQSSGETHLVKVCAVCIPMVLEIKLRKYTVPKVLVIHGLIT